MSVVLSTGLYQGLRKSTLTFFVAEPKDIVALTPGQVIPCKIFKVKGKHEAVVVLQELLEDKRNKAPWIK